MVLSSSEDPFRTCFPLFRISLLTFAGSPIPTFVISNWQRKEEESMRLRKS